MRKILFPFLFLYVGLLVVVLPVVGQDDRTSAESVATRWLQGIDQGDLTALYQRHAGPTFTGSVTLQQFTDQNMILRLQLGGVAEARQLLGGQPFQQAPNGQTGTFFYFRFKSRYKSGSFLFQDVYMEKTNGEWKVSGYWLAPAPPG